MDNETESTSPLGPADSPSQYEWLCRKLSVILILMIVAVGALDMFLMRQWKANQRDARTLNAVFEDYQKTNGPPIEYFFQKTLEYARTHEGFRPVLAKYGIVFQTNAPAPLPAPNLPATPKK